MKRKSLSILVISFLLGVLFFGICKPKAITNDNIFDYILNNIDGNVVEYGLTTNFQHYGEGEKVCKDILKDLKVNQNNYSNTIKNEKIYCIEFKDNNLEGYVQSTKYDGYSIITINLSEKNKINELNKIEKKLITISKNKDIKFFEYVKAQINEKDLKKTNNKVVTLLKNIRGQNIETVKLDNGYSTTAYVKKNSPININGKLIDFNYAVCSYYSGNYIIMGTPEILISY